MNHTFLKIKVRYLPLWKLLLEMGFFKEEQGHIEDYCMLFSLNVKTLLVSYVMHVLTVLKKAT